MKTESLVFSWGLNQHNQLGISSEVHRRLRAPTSSPLFRNKFIQEIASGPSHAIFLSDLGTCYACGNNKNGRLGRKNEEVKPEPLSSVISQKIKHIACGHFHSMLLTHDGLCFAFGRNKEGQLGLPPEKFLYVDEVPIPTLVQGPLLGLFVFQISCGKFHSVFISSGPWQSDIWACGDTWHGQVGSGAYSDSHSDFLLPDHERDPENEVFRCIQPHPVSLPYHDTNGSSHIVESVTCGAYHTLVAVDGNIYSWGSNLQGQCGSNSDLDFSPVIPLPLQVYTTEAAMKKLRVDLLDTKEGVNLTMNTEYCVSVKAGDKHSLALTQSGHVYAWGDTTSGQTGQDELFNVLSDVSIEDGEFENKQYIPIRVKHSLMRQTIVQLAAGAYHSLALSAKGEVFTWGTQESSSPVRIINTPQYVRIPNNKKITAIAAGGRNSYCISSPIPRLIIPSSIVLYRIVYLSQNILILFNIIFRDPFFNNHKSLGEWKEKIIALFNDGKQNPHLFQDLILHCKDGKSLYIHRCFAFQSGLLRQQLPVVEIGPSETNKNISDVTEITLSDINIGDATIIARYMYGADINPKHYPDMFSHFSVERTDSLGKLMQSWVNNFDIYPTVTFTFEETQEEVCAHKSLLACLSPVFACMFTDNFVEKTRLRIPLVGVDPEAFVLFLQYLYTDEVTTTDIINLARLFVLADVYCVPRLKILCHEAMINKIDFDTFFQLLEFAEEYQANVLYSCCQEFLLNNHNTLKENDDFLRLLLTKPHFKKLLKQRTKDVKKEKCTIQ